MSLLIYCGIPGIAPVADSDGAIRTAAMLVLGDCDPVQPIHVQFAPVVAAGVEAAYLHAIHVKDPLCWTT